MKQRQWLICVSTVIGLAVISLFFTFWDNSPSNLTDSTGTYFNTQNKKEHGYNIADSSIQEGRLSFEADLAVKLKEEYGSQIQHLSVQASLIAVQYFVLSRYPEDGMSRFKHIIGLAFPNMAFSILRILEKMSKYNEWLDEHYIALTEMSPLEADGILWGKRQDIFGNDAEVIWANERNLFSQQQLKVQNELYELNKSVDISLDETLYQLKQVVSDAYDNTEKGFPVTPAMTSQVFFNFESVQEKLKLMSPEKRQETINSSRKQLGFNKEQILRFEQQDKKRNRRWDNGLAYMNERNKMKESLSGEALEASLKNLRKSYFKHEAATIEKEEKSDFFRYKRQRIYGKN